ncbi:PRC-barrel domain-containing protein [Pseudoclavibacter alba]|uniref:PRC-barrel domain-containing protein n=1 Tax=Pseudoclavibacter albus TaxID=272241 RepID=A0ABT2HV51_9MICO|nr:PRC-barrel domain-containing protein [Pseudoclavibacter alba]MCT2042203.1 PRC-barrel domain-containing protein [Pseudoclavibacter alba]
MLPAMPLQRLLGRRVYDCNGAALGTLDRIFLDDRYRLPSWAIVRTGFLWGHSALVPLEDARIRPRGVVVAVTRRAIQRAPRIKHREGHLTADEETTLYEHYGITVPSGDTGPIEVTREPKSQRRRREEPSTVASEGPVEQLGAPGRTSSYT